jgi:hypothetical protein
VFLWLMGTGLAHLRAIAVELYPAGTIAAAHIGAAPRWGKRRR